jgi:hypothetical protein
MVSDKRTSDFPDSLARFHRKAIVLERDHNEDSATLGAKAAGELASDQSTNSITEYASSPVSSLVSPSDLLLS